MSKLPVISGAECIKALEKIGFVVDRGTLRAIIRQVGLSVEEFSVLLRIR